MPRPAHDTPGSAASSLAATGAHFVVAVSGGLDSMVLLHAAARVVPAARLTVATFDHGTGAPATAAADHVEAAARDLALPCVRGGGHPLPPSEAAWRAARWRFLRSVAADVAAALHAQGRAHPPSPPVRIVTAHTADDQAETILMRAMRDAGARGLAALLVRSDVVRPFLCLRRSALVGYARGHDVRWVEDPSNATPRFLRNRLRHDVLPALERARPGLVAELLAIGARAAAWREEMDAIALACCPSAPSRRDGLSVAAADLVGYDPSSLAVLWSSIAGRVGVALDRRGTRRLVAFTTSGVDGAVMPLSGGWQAMRVGGRLALERAAPPPPPAATFAPRDGVAWGAWRFTPGDAAEGGGAWEAVLPRDGLVTVRAWEPTDRMRVGPGLVRVKRVLAEAGIAAADRVGWPVVVADDAIVWIPGVSRAQAATARSGRPGVCIRCEPSDG